jgi:hypothetical protein
MTQIYFRSFIITLIILSAVLPQKGFSQCPNGYVPDGVAFDTTINFSSGRMAAVLRFPKFDPTVGMVTCARLTMEMTGTLNALWMENYDATPKTASAHFTRNDTITGDGLSGPLLNAESQTYGTYNLSPSDGSPNSGPDYTSVPPGEIFTRSTSFLITNVSDLANFYGPVGDSLTYNYSVDSRTTVDITGNWLGGVITTGSVTYRLEYCYCPIELLPINAFDFTVRKVDDKAHITWKANNDVLPFYYEVEYSTDGRNFTRAAVIEKQSSNSGIISYNYLFEKNNVNEIYYFRLKQKFSTGKLMLSQTKSIDFGTDQSFKFSLYPNPSSGIIGIKFDNNKTRKILVSVTNVQGQTILNKIIEITDVNYRQIATVEKGMYWVKTVDLSSQKTCVNQLLIK